MGHSHADDAPYKTAEAATGILASFVLFAVLAGVEWRALPFAVL
ncbi:hypothetical protein BH18ACI4_BH18ACI4_07310 [soil metagenome]